MIPWLDTENPDFDTIEESQSSGDGLLAGGGNLKIITLLQAYPRGIFPWFNNDEPILWWSPDPRLVLHPEELHLSRSVRRKLHKKTWKVTLNHDFPEVIRQCAQTRRGGQETWITGAMRDAYVRMHEAGFAHSVEVFHEARLVGGLYGVGIGLAFFGESMFTLKSDASKIALFHFCEYLKRHHFPLIDCQIESSHLLSLGAYLMPRAEFVKTITSLCTLPAPRGLWQAQVLHEAPLEIPVKPRSSASKPAS